MMYVDRQRERQADHMANTHTADDAATTHLHIVHVCVYYLLLTVIHVVMGLAGWGVCTTTYYIALL